MEIESKEGKNKAQRRLQGEMTGQQKDVSMWSVLGQGKEPLRLWPAEVVDSIPFCEPLQLWRVTHRQ